MKVFVVAFLLLAVSSLEAAVVKRQTETYLTDQFSSTFSKLHDILKSSTDELVKKIQVQDLQSQAQTYLDKTKETLEPLKAEFEKMLQSLMSIAQQQ